MTYLFSEDSQQFLVGSRISHYTRITFIQVFKFDLFVCFLDNAWFHRNFILEDFLKNHNTGKISLPKH